MAKEDKTVKATESEPVVPAATIRVKGNKADGSVVLWERDDAHPGGEVFIAGQNGPFTVAETPEVLRKIAAQELVKV